MISLLICLLSGFKDYRSDFVCIFLGTSLNTASPAALSDSTVPEDAGIEPKTVAALALAV
jgi:hypothetical protein